MGNNVFCIIYSNCCSVTLKCCVVVQQALCGTGLHSDVGIGQPPITELLETVPQATVPRSQPDRPSRRTEEEVVT